MLEFVKEILLINAYWFSLPLIGVAILSFTRSTKRLPKIIRDVAEFSYQQHFIVRLLFGFATAMFILGVVAILCYIFSTPAIIFTATYCLLVIFSLVVLGRRLIGSLFSKKNLNIFSLDGSLLIVKLVFVVMIAFVIGDFLLSIYTRSYMLVSADSFFHLSRIVSILGQGFTTESGFFLGVPETAYHFNIVYAFYLPPAQLFNISAASVWEYSLGFFRLVQWVALFTLAWHVAIFWLKDKSNALLVSMLFTIFAISYFGGVMFSANYPNVIVIAWLILLVVGVSLYEFGRKFGFVIALMAAFLATATHPTYALMAAGLLSLIVIFKAIMLRKKIKTIKKDVLFYLGTIVVLMLGPVRTIFLPTGLSADQKAIGDFKILEVGPLSIKDPSFIISGTLIEIGVFALAVLGLAFLLYRVRQQKTQFLIVLALVLFFPLIAYEPVGFMIFSHFLPQWVIDRFGAMSILNFVAIPLGVYGIFRIVQHFGSKSKSVTHHRLWPQRVPIALSIGVIIMIAWSAALVIPSAQKVVVSRVGNEHYYAFMDRIYADFGGILNEKKTVVANTGDSYLIAAVLPVNVIAIEEGHTTPSADAKDRIACQTQLMQSFNYNDLNVVKADYVVIAKYEPRYKDQKAIADTKPYLVFAAENQDFYIYRFDEQASILDSASTPACKAYQIAEAELN